MKIESICIYLKVCLFEVHLTEDVILYFACGLMFDRRSRNFFFNDTSSSNSKTILSKYFLILLFSNFLESVLLLFT